MSTHNIGFYEEISKIITKLSSNILKYAPYFFSCIPNSHIISYFFKNIQVWANSVAQDKTAHEQTYQGLLQSLPFVGITEYSMAEPVSNNLRAFTFEPRREKTGFLHMRKQRRRSASR